MPNDTSSSSANRCLNRFSSTSGTSGNAVKLRFGNRVRWVGPLLLVLCGSPVVRSFQPALLSRQQLVNLAREFEQFLRILLDCCPERKAVSSVHYCLALAPHRSKTLKRANSIRLFNVEQPQGPSGSALSAVVAWNFMGRRRFDMFASRHDSPHFARLYLAHVCSTALCSMPHRNRGAFIGLNMNFNLSALL
jgi:hypothetical protein